MHGANSQSFMNIDLKQKIDLFCPPEEFATNELLIQWIQKQIRSNECSRFYQILNSNFWELELSDSETDSESENVEAVKAIHKEYTCSKCGQPYDRLYKIVQHMKNDHELSEFDDVKCEHCSKVFPNNSILEKHLRTQCQNTQKEISCPICKIRFMWQSSCAKHSDKMHLRPAPYTAPRRTTPAAKPKEKSFICDFCSKGFYRIEHLERHRKIHLPAEKKFSCDLCKKKFNRKDNLK